MPAVNLRHIEIFHAVMTTGNLTEAARMLHTSQPTVSRELARFEKVLGLTLFSRTRGRLQPTVGGYVCLKRSSALVRSGQNRQRRGKPARVPPWRAVDSLSAGLFAIAIAAAAGAVFSALSAGEYSNCAARVAATGGVVVGPAPRSGIDGNPAYAGGDSKDGTAFSQ